MIRRKLPSTSGEGDIAEDSAEPVASEEVKTESQLRRQDLHQVMPKERRGTNSARM